MVHDSKKRDFNNRKLFTSWDIGEQLKDAMNDVDSSAGDAHFDAFEELKTIAKSNFSRLNSIERIFPFKITGEYDSDLKVSYVNGLVYSRFEILRVLRDDSSVRIRAYGVYDNLMFTDYVIKEFDVSSKEYKILRKSQITL